MTSKEYIQGVLYNLEETLKLAKETNNKDLELDCEMQIKSYNQVLKDLEVLDILKTQTRERKIKPTKLWNREKKQINGYQIKALINLNEEQYDKLKEWQDGKD